MPLLALVLAQIAFSVGASVTRTASTVSTAPLLPGETLWGGVPSYLFGEGDTYNYLAGFDGNASIQSQVKAAGVPLIRAFFEQTDQVDHTTPVSDSHQLAIAQAIANSGAACMANLTQPSSLATSAQRQSAITYDLHLVSILAPHCRYFEVMNEPDLSGVWPPAVTSANYLAFWDAFVPQARAEDPNGLFGGPALASEFGLNDNTYMQTVLKGLAQSGVAPDFITYHWYICSGVAQSSCLADTAQWTPGHGKTVYGWLQTYFPGRSIPLGITEWNADPGNPSWAYDDTLMSQFEAAALHGFESNPYLGFLTQYDLAAYAGYGTLDMFRTATSEPYTNTPSAIGSARPMFAVLAGEIARLSSGSSGGGSGSTPTPTLVPPSPTPVPPSPTPQPTSSGVPRYAHVITILEENHGYSEIVGNTSSAPYINGTLIPSGALATNYTANVASSLPNYLALTGGSTLDLTNNCSPGPGCESSGPSIASETLAARLIWKAYEENMTANCQNVVDGGLNNLYTVHHNPFPYYTGLVASCATNDVNYSQLATDLRSPSTLPNYVFITPNLNDDMHNGTILQGDTWLSQQVPLIQSSAACQQSSCLIAVTFDESTNGVAGSSEQVMTVLVGPGVAAGMKDGTAYTHYNLLRTEEAALGLPTMTANDAAAAPMLGMFTRGASPTPTPTPTQPPSPTPTPVSGTLFSDDFEADAVGSSPVGWTVDSGTWAISQDTSHVLKATSSTAGYIWAGDKGWTNYTITASVKPDPTVSNNMVNLMGRYVDSNNHYSLILKYGNQWWLGVKENGTWTTLANGIMPFTSTFYTLSLTFSGSMITARVNGTVLATKSSTAITAGAIGFNGSLNSEFDNVVVTGSGTPIPTPTPSPSPTPSPTPAPAVACVELVNGVMTIGQCSGSFTPSSQPAPSESVPCIEWQNGAFVSGACLGTFTANPRDDQRLAT